jgi:hypothetical protein
MKKTRGPAKQRKARPVLRKGKSAPAAPTLVRKRTAKLASPSKNPPLLLQVYGAANFFAQISKGYVEATEGYRAQLYDFAARCYKIGVGFNRRLDVFQRFKNDEFWDGARQKPKDDKVMKAVVTFAMKAKSKHLLSRVSKTASVLETLAEQGVKPSDVAKRLRDGGGIEKMYAALSPNRNGNARVPDDLEMLDPRLAEDDGDDGGAEGEVTSGDKPPSDEDWSHATEDSDVNTDHPKDLIGEPPAMPRASKGEPVVTEFGGIASPPKPPSVRAIFDPSNHLLIDMSASGVSIEEALNMGELRIMAVVEPADDSDYRAVRAVSVTKAALIAGLRKKLDNDEAGD